jgi:hypothetical protein
VAFRFRSVTLEDSPPCGADPMSSFGTKRKYQSPNPSRAREGERASRDLVERFYNIVWMSFH